MLTGKSKKNITQNPNFLIMSQLNSPPENKDPPLGPQLPKQKHLKPLREKFQAQHDFGLVKGDECQIPRWNFFMSCWSFLKTTILVSFSFNPFVHIIENSLTYFKTLRWDHRKFLKYAWPFFEIMPQMVYSNTELTTKMRLASKH